MPKTNSNPYNQAQDTVTRSISFDPRQFETIEEVGSRPRYKVARSGLVRIALDLLFAELGEPGYVRPSLEELRAPHAKGKGKR